MALTGPFPAAITIPKCAQDGTSDYEAELCVIISKTGRDIPEERALEYVLGYTATNDVSARTLQLAARQWSFSKGLDNSCPIGMFLDQSLPHRRLIITLQAQCLFLPRPLMTHNPLASRPFIMVKRCRTATQET